MLVFILLHLYVTRRSFIRELVLVLVSATIGLGLDNALASTGFVMYVGTPSMGYAPLWLVAIWAGFGTTVRHSQDLFFRSGGHAFLTGFFGGPLAYAGGVKLGCIQVTSVWGYALIGLFWTVAMILLFYCRGKGPAPQSSIE